MAERKRYAIVTGAASGLGRALCLELAKEGWCVCAADVNEAGARETIRMVADAGGTGLAQHLDVTRLEQWQELSKRLRSQWPHLDLLVNNAGVAGAGRVGEFPIEDWRWILDVNIYNAVYGCHVFVDWLKTNPSGAHIINTASMAGIASPPTMAAYNVSKAAVIGLSETLWSELRRDRVGVTVLCPEFFKTNLLDNPRISDPDALGWARKAFERSPFTAEDVARAAVRAMKRKQLYVILPKAARWRWCLKRLFPTYFLGKVASIFEKAAAKKRT
jgi:NAD(P)-dependent dehydrogenase (short-subunit alcohol dehydrogenase family)